jgi:hypothetical protein
MPLFRKKRDDKPVDMNERSPQLGVRYKDLAVLDQLMKNGACETHAVTSPELVREADDFFQGLADRHGAEYDGWEAST